VYGKLDEGVGEIASGRMEYDEVVGREEEEEEERKVKGDDTDDKPWTYDRWWNKSSLDEKFMVKTMKYEETV